MARKQTTFRGWCIINHLGEPWTPHFFDTKADGEHYLAARSQEAWTKGGLSKHKVVRASFTLRPSRDTGETQ